MQKLRWVMDGEFWDLDMSTPLTLDGVARPAAAASGGGGADDRPLTLPLGVSRGTTLSRPKQIDFFQRFMYAPFVPSYAGRAQGFSLQRVLAFPFGDYWLATLLGQFNLQKFVSCIKENRSTQPPDSSWLRNIGRNICNKSLYALNFCSEILVTPDDTVLFSVEQSDSKETARKKAVVHHKFLNHNLTVEAAWPELFVDHLGTYWDVPFSMAIDLASVASDSGSSYHFSINHNQGRPLQHGGQVDKEVLTTMRPGLCVKNAFSLKKTIDIWRSNAPKLRMVQPFDIFLSNPHISASGIVGAVLTACLGENSATSLVEEKSQLLKGLTFHAPRVNSTISADIFGSMLFSAQHGNFQKLFLDLTRIHARLDFPSGSKFLSSASLLAQDFYNSHQPRVEALKAICPKVTISLQQQIAGPISFRVDSGASLNLNSSSPIIMNDPVFAIEYALQVLGSAKAVAWYSPNQQEFMIELRFFET